MLIFSFAEFLISRKIKDSVYYKQKGDDKMEFINLTPHDIHIISADSEKNQTEKTIPASGQCARCNVQKKLCDYVDNIPIYETSYGNVQGLPDPKKGVVYIVSTIVAEACKEQRDDLLVPFDFVRDEHGNIIGCKSFSKVR